MRILFDPTLYEVSEADVAFANDYLEQLFQYLDDYVGPQKIEMTSSLSNDFYNYVYLIPKGASTIQQAFKAFLGSNMLKRIDCLDGDGSVDSACFTSFRDASVSTDTFDHFTKMIGGFSANIKDYLLFLGNANFTNAPSISFVFRDNTYELSVVGDINDLDVRLFSDSLRNLILVNAEKPSLESPLPNKKLCKEILDYQINETKSANVSSKTSIILKCAKEVAKRNFYKYSQKVTSMNNNEGVIRHIFVDAESEKDIYISIDIRHGNFEVYNSKGKHKDEYDYCGNPQNKTDNTNSHDIKVP